MTRRLDDQQQRFAAQVEQDHRDWVIMWGYYSRLYWAFPRFNVPPGTVVAAPAPGELTEAMRRAEIAAALAPRFEAAPPARPRRPEPPPGQRPGGRRPARAAVAAGKQPARAAVAAGKQPARAAVAAGKQPARAAVAAGKQPAGDEPREPEAGVREPEASVG